MTIECVPQLGHDVLRHQDVDRDAGLAKPPKQVQRVMVEPGERLGCKQQVDDDALGHRIRAWHVGDVSKGSVTVRPRRPS